MNNFTIYDAASDTVENQKSSFDTQLFIVNFRCELPRNLQL